MLLCGIIDELSKMAMDKTNISFFFCQATNSRINNATAVLRGLIYMHLYVPDFPWRVVQQYSTDELTPTNSGVSTPSPIQTGMVSTCDKFYKVIADDGCYDIANDHGIPLASFYTWNPAVKTDCSGLQANEYICVSVKSTSTSAVTATTSVSGVTTPSPIQTGMVSTCDTFYDVQSGNSCYDIADTHGVSLDSFYAWNPAVKTDCSGLQANEYVCVGVSSS